MANDDRSLKDLIKFLDANNSLDDSSVAKLAVQLKFSEVLDLVSLVKAGDTASAKKIIARYDQSFAAAPEENNQEETQEAAIQPIKPTTSTMGKSSFPKIQPNQGNNSQEDETDLDQLVNDPQNQNDPNVRQIKNLLQRMQK